MSELSSLLQARLQRAKELNEYAEHTRDVLVPELWRLCVPWRFLAWRKLSKEIDRRNDYVRQELAKVETPPSVPPSKEDEWSEYECANQHRWWSAPSSTRCPVCGTSSFKPFGIARGSLAYFVVSGEGDIDVTGEDAFGV